MEKTKLDSSPVIEWMVTFYTSKFGIVFMYGHKKFSKQVSKEVASSQP